MQPASVSRRAFLKGSGCLLISFSMPLVVRRARAAGPAMDAGSQLVSKDKVDSFIAITAEGNVVACNGHVDLGTGIRTAFSQIVADELYVPMERVSMVLGDTDRTPNQGPTIASASVQSSAVPMRRAAAQAREFLLGQASRRLGVPVDQLTVRNGVVSPAGAAQGLSYGEMVKGETFAMELSEDVPLKDPEDYDYVGKPVPRVDIPAKLTGGLIYVHDMRVPGMLHARVVRPPYRGRDGGDMVGNSLEAVDKESVAHIDTLVDVVAIKDFLAVVAEREEDAIDAARALKVAWTAPPPLQDLSDLAEALRANPDKVRPLEKKGDVDLALEGASRTLRATYVWPYQMHGSIGPSCGLADWKDGLLTVWSGSQNPHNLHSDIAELLDLAEEKIRVVRMEASGCYGRNCADDAAAEAALLAHHLGRPVRVQLMREEEHAWEPKGTAQLMEVVGGITGENTLAYRFTTRYPSNGSPTLPLLMVGKQSNAPTVFEMGDRTAIPQYRCSDTDIEALDMAPIVRASWIRGVAALPNVFAHESFIDELAAAEKADPVEFRLRFMEDERPIALVKAVAERAQWAPRPAHQGKDGVQNGLLHGRGFSQHQYVHGAFPGVGASWCAWAVEVEVNPATGYIRVRKAVVGQDCGLMINPAGVVHQLHGNVIQAISRTLKEQVSFDERGVIELEWGAYPILSFPEVPDIDVVLMPDNGNPPLGAGESASVPGAAAIANAIFDATGVRLRQAPFTPERMRAALSAQGEDKA
ncbi:molybdopterin cofactor-binding domain-containing protein [Pusillimonas sp.]|uniref:xanthine dehydrogenase family protein molybdopterin-binding subunit n=1 Tax=Pusillimonas sp. TaxID=3040095 RepID=UPI0037CCB4DC